MTNTDKIVRLEQLQTYDTLIKEVIATESGKAIKNVELDGQTLVFYKTLDKTDEKPIRLDISAEYLEGLLFDNSKSGAVDNFVWSEEEYPGSTNPDLDGKPVFVFGITSTDGEGNETTKYTFASLEGLLSLGTYKGKETSTATVTVDNETNEVFAEVKISAKEGNVLTVDDEDGGLFVEAGAVGDLNYADDEDINAMFRKN